MFKLLFLNNIYYLRDCCITVDSFFLNIHFIIYLTKNNTCLLLKIIFRNQKLCKGKSRIPVPFSLSQGLPQLTIANIFMYIYAYIYVHLYMSVCIFLDIHTCIHVYVLVYFFNGIIGYVLAACFSYKISCTSFCHCSHPRTRSHPKTRRERRMGWRERENIDRLPPICLPIDQQSNLPPSGVQDHVPTS